MVYIFMMSKHIYFNRKTNKRNSKCWFRNESKKDVKVLVYWENDPNLMILIQYIMQQLNI